jgi:two-component system phosphate regulon sensor histidine kinase PhoR
MSISVIGICGLEYYWVVSAIKAEREEFDRSAQRALHAAITELEKTEAEILLMEKLGKPIPGLDITYDYKRSENGETFVISEFRINDTIPTKRSHKIEWLKEPDFEGRPIEPEIVEIREDEGNVIRKEVIRAGDDNREEVMIFVTSTGDSIKTTSTARSFERKLNVYSDALQEVIVRDFGKNYSLEDRIGNMNLDSLLTEKLYAEGIASDFDWNITQDKQEMSGTGVSEKPNKASVLDFRAPVFPEMPDEVILSIGFPSKDLYVFKNLGGMLGLVVLFSLFMIITFATTLNMILKQKKLSEVKSDFINNMTHEFKTPLATIGLALDSIKHPGVAGKPDQIDKFTGIIAQENKRLTSHVEKILQLAKMEKGELVISKESTDLNELIEEAIQSFQLKLEARGCMLTVDLEKNLSALMIDPSHIFNAVANLIDNAIKYSPETPVINITSRRKLGFVEVQVEDEGIGMSPEEQKKAFKTFYRAQKGDLHNVKGFGLGLSYTREVIRLHGGEMILKSQAGKGTTIGFKLPCP